jgi:hypothetical protein
MAVGTVIQPHVVVQEGHGRGGHIEEVGRVDFTSHTRAFCKLQRVFRPELTKTKEIKEAKEVEGWK